MNTPREVLSCDTRHVGRRVEVYAELGSTNDVALASEPGTVIVAEHQTAGRGQYGRVWTARPGSSLLLSVALAPPPDLLRPVILTAWAAVAVAEAVQHLAGRHAAIKWPNDLLVGGKKVCGILIEQRGTTAVGVGLNLNQTAEEFALAGLPEATSLAALSGHPIDPRAALEAVVRHLDDHFDRLLSGDRGTLEAAWKTRLGLIGKEVIVEQTDGRTLSARLRDLSFDGLELVSDDSPLPLVLKPEAVRHVRGG